MDSLPLAFQAEDETITPTIEYKQCLKFFCEGVSSSCNSVYLLTIHVRICWMCKRHITEQKTSITKHFDLYRSQFFEWKNTATYKADVSEIQFERIGHNNSMQNLHSHGFFFFGNFHKIIHRIELKLEIILWNRYEI